MINPKLVPRLNYGYSLTDSFISLIGIFKKPPQHTYLINLFHNENIFFVNHARTALRLILNSIGLNVGAKIGVQALTVILFLIPLSPQVCNQCFWILTIILR